MEKKRERERPRLVKEPLDFPGKCKGTSVSVYIGSLYPLIVPHRAWSLWWSQAGALMWQTDSQILFNHLFFSLVFDQEFEAIRVLFVTVVWLVSRGTSSGCHVPCLTGILRRMEKLFKQIRGISVVDLNARKTGRHSNCYYWRVHLDQTALFAFSIFICC